MPNRLIPNAATPNPIVPQKWLFRQSIDYSVSLNYAVLNYASRYRDELLMNIYRMGRNAIDKGNKDSWTLSPAKVEAINKLYEDSLKRRPAADGNRPGSGAVPVKFYDSVMKNSNYKDPRGYIIPADQPDLATAVEFLNALIRTGIVVQKASADFTVAGKKYPANSYIVKTNQAFRPHILDMFEPQDHPNDFLYPGGPPVAPYDAAGWTLAYQMGVKFDRIKDGFDGPFEKNPLGQLIKLRGAITRKNANGYVLDARANQSYKAVNQLLNAGVDVYRITKVAAGASYNSGSFYFKATANAKAVIDRIINESPVEFIPLDQSPASTLKIKKARIALWDTYGGSMSSGWVRLILEKYNYAFDVIYPKDIDSSNLELKYDVIVFVGGAIPALNGNTQNTGRGAGNTDSIPDEFKRMTGRITAEKSIPKLRSFLEQGGNIVTIGSSTQLAYHLKLPVTNAMTEIINGEEKVLPKDKFYTPGSILQMHVDEEQTATAGLNGLTDIYFDNSPVFKLAPDAVSSGIIKPLAWFGNDDQILRSGWSWGETYLKNGVTAFEAKTGKGKLFAFTPEITFRGQSQG
ncbi:MAG TPA: peptidase, partial [Ferruginibacter sp.]|nr:peptidase [Ferruginibacter sp.]